MDRDFTPTAEEQARLDAAYVDGGGLSAVDRMLREAWRIFLDRIENNSAMVYANRFQGSGCGPEHFVGDEWIHPGVETWRWERRPDDTHRARLTFAEELPSDHLFEPGPVPQPKKT